MTPSWWRQFAQRLAVWIDEQGLSPRDVVLLLPFAQLLPLAREAWALRAPGGWSPRFETTQTLSAALAPPRAASATDLSFDPATDRLSAAALLRAQGWARDWLRRDRRGYEQAVARLVDTAQAMARASAAVPPAERDAYWSRGRTLLAPVAGTGSSERLLARVALEWAAASAAPATDVLFAHRPGAWAALTVTGVDPLVVRLLQHAVDAGVPALWLQADVALTEPFSGVQAPALVVARDAEDEAQRSAAQVLVHLVRGEAPVALIAQDRVLVRRIHALLDRSGIAVADETGWKLSTTRAAAALMSLLRAARPVASTDDWLDWLKSGAAAWPGLVGAGLSLTEHIGSIEQRLRRDGITRAWSFDPAALQVRLHPEAAALWQRACDVLQALRGLAAQPLSDALGVLRDTLNDCGVWETLAADAAGRQVLAALRLMPGSGAGAAWEAAAHGARVDLDGLLAWVDEVLEQVAFHPDPPPEGATIDVFITPLARAVLRPFAAVVMPGTDEAHLGAGGKTQPLLSEAAATEMGLPTLGLRRDAELCAFALLLRHPQLTLLRRQADGDQPLAASPLLERVELSLVRRGLEFVPASDPRLVEAVPVQPLHMPAPALVGDDVAAAAPLWPRRLDATAYTHLRACPYRFLALKALGLREADELDDAVEARDYGTWLHAVLQRFHGERQTQLWPAQEDLAHLLAAAHAVQAEQGWDDADFLPFAAGFERLAPAYVAWLQKEEAAGAAFVRSEVALSWYPDELALPGLPPIELQGRLDRLDRVSSAEGRQLRIVDYKTSSSESLRKKAAEPLEDTQLPFYAALLEGARYGDANDTGVEAGYLAFEGAEVKWIPHADVAMSAQQLLEGLVDDVQRIAGGAALPALGEGAACEYCAARGLCRRDHWAPTEGDEEGG